MIGIVVGGAEELIVTKPSSTVRLRGGCDRIAVGDDERPAGVAVTALAGLDVRHAVDAGAGFLNALVTLTKPL